ncbi:MAG: FeoB-associated Cys-rich membrane protein [Bacteroidales bacterium]|nr:FeoB-associated Cys-rich membrane protein [Bacteroidales bacterium]MBP5680850.1 FeoB-associated Cys-rich membrane protein [Bacteroidales bacterium]
MNLISVILLIIILSAFVSTIVYLVKKNRRGPTCGSCSCCGDSGCPMRR